MSQDAKFTSPAPQTTACVLTVMWKVDLRKSLASNTRLFIPDMVVASLAQVAVMQ